MGGAAGVPLLLCMARNGMLHRLLMWAAAQGLLQTSQAANPNTIDELETLPYQAELFADPGNPEDTRPPGECCICFDPYDESREIKRTPCGHCFHRECLGVWLQTVRTCPVCRKDLDEHVHGEEDASLRQRRVASAA